MTRGRRASASLDPQRSDEPHKAGRVITPFCKNPSSYKARAVHWELSVTDPRRERATSYTYRVNRPYGHFPHYRKYSIRCFFPFLCLCVFGVWLFFFGKKRRERERTKVQRREESAREERSRVNKNVRRRFVFVIENRLWIGRTINNLPSTAASYLSLFRLLSGDGM